MKKISRADLCILLLLLLFLGVTAALYPSLPAQIPMHWSYTGAIDQFGPRVYAFWLTGLNALLAALLRFLPRIDPRRENYAKFSRAYDVFRVVLCVFMGMLLGVTLYSAFYPNALDVGRITTGGVGNLICVAGNFMPKFRHNYFIGVRTPWTLASEDVWYATHRLAGKLWVGGGIAILALTFFPSGLVSACILFAILLVLILVPTIFSYLRYQSRNQD